MKRKLSDPLNIDNSMFSPPEIPECPTCGEYLHTDYRGQVQECQWCNMPPVPKRCGGALRFILFLSIMALIGVLLARWLFGEPETAPHALYVVGGPANNAWMIIHRADTKAAQQRGFDPSYTYVIVEYKPVVKKLANGKWAIQFTSEIAEDIP